MLWRRLMRSFGRDTIKVREDHASEVTGEFLKDINNELDEKDRFEILLPFERIKNDQDHGIEVYKAPPEEYEKFFERSWQTYQRDTANALLNQCALTDDYWLYALLDSIGKRNGVLPSSDLTMTPMQKMTCMKPDTLQMAKFRYGALAIGPRVNKGKDMNVMNFGLMCVVAQMTPGSFMVIREGTSKVAVPF
jgi:hypothetical protein